MHKRLLGLLGAGLMIVTACGGATTSSAPAASAPPAASGGASEQPAGSPSAAAADLADEQILRVTLGSEDPDTLDASKASTSTSIGVLHALNRGLLYVDHDLAPVPSLAEALPELSADGLTYTFKLRDAKYSNGDPIVAADLVYAWRRLVDPRTASQYQAIIQDVVGAQALIDMTGKDPAPSPADIDAALAKLGVAAPDDKTFTVTLTHPTGYFLEHRDTVEHGADAEEVGRDSELHRSGELRQLRPVHDEGIGPTRPRSCSSRTRTGMGPSRPSRNST